MLLVDDDRGRRCASGANTAERVPTTTSMSPRRMRCHWSWRSPSDRPLCWMATRSPNAVAEQRRDRRRQRDFRHEHQHAAAGARDGGREAQVDLGLAAAGDAVQQRDVERARVGQRRAAASSAAACSPVSRRSGLGRLRRRRRPLGRIAIDAVCRRLDERIAVDALGAYADVAALRQPRIASAAIPRAASSAVGKSVGRARQQLQRLALLRRQLPAPPRAPRARRR